MADVYCFSHFIFIIFSLWFYSIFFEKIRPINFFLTINLNIFFDRKFAHWLQIKCFVYSASDTKKMRWSHGWRFGTMVAIRTSLHQRARTRQYSYYQQQHPKQNWIRSQPPGEESSPQQNHCFARTWHTCTDTRFIHSFKMSCLIIVEQKWSTYESVPAIVLNTFQRQPENTAAQIGPSFFAEAKHPINGPHHCRSFWWTQKEPRCRGRHRRGGSVFFIRITPQPWAKYIFTKAQFLYLRGWAVIMILCFCLGPQGFFWRDGQIQTRPWDFERNILPKFI